MTLSSCTNIISLKLLHFEFTTTICVKEESPFIFYYGDGPDNEDSQQWGDLIQVNWTIAIKKDLLDKKIAKSES